MSGGSSRYPHLSTQSVARMAEDCMRSLAPHEFLHRLEREGLIEDHQAEEVLEGLNAEDRLGFYKALIRFFTERSRDQAIVTFMKCQKLLSKQTLGLIDIDGFSESDQEPEAPLVMPPSPPLKGKALPQKPTYDAITAKPPGRPSTPGGGAMSKPDKIRTIFLVHGRDLDRVKELTTFLRHLDLFVVPWDDARKWTGKGNPYVHEIIDTGMDASQATMVLFTGDDEARLLNRFHKPDESTEEKELTPQARPNVIYEAGLAMGRDQSRGRVIFVRAGRLRKISDIDGMHIPALNNSVDTREDLIKRLETAGVKLTRSSGWHTAGNLE